MILRGNEYKIILPKRDNNCHKGTLGTLAVVGGCRSYQGAPYFAAKAALRTGVGIVAAFIPDEIVSAFCSRLSGPVIESLNSSSGFIDDDTIADKILKRKVNSVVLGCGLGISDSLLKTVSNVLSLDLPMVVDGDALTAVSTNLEMLDRDAPTVLTPHLGELSRLLKMPVEEILKNRASLVSDFSVKNNCFTVSKDSSTVISDPTGKVFILNKPCSALSKGGSGDVLAGMIGSFIAQGISITDSIISAVTLHNACGIAAAKRFGHRFSQPDDYILMLQKVIK